MEQIVPDTALTYLLMKKRIFSFIICSLLFSCKNASDKALENALQKAGANRPEMEKVLTHYPSSSLQHEAAKFLIENMDEKFHYEGAQYDRFLHFIDSISPLCRYSDDYKHALDSFLKANKTLVGETVKVYDIQILKADYLIRNIDHAFSTYHTAGWNKNISFEDFCEYILPYKIGTEIPEQYREEFYQKYGQWLTVGPADMRSITDSVLKRTSAQKMDIIIFPGFVPDFSISQLQKIRGGTCRETSYEAIYVLRSLGIPIAYDFTPQWPNRGIGHSWAALLIRPDTAIDFEGAISSVTGDHLKLSNTIRIAKVYRRTYSKQAESLLMQHGDEPIPVSLSDAYCKDVSSTYFKCIDIPVTLSQPTDNKFAYLCVFDNQSWNPIAWTHISSGKAVFTNMGKPVIYLPAICNKTGLQPCADPIMVDSTGAIHTLVSNGEVLQTIHLNRKYPVFDWWNTRTALLQGSEFQAANKSDFSDAVTVYNIDNIPEMTYQTVIPNTQKAYRYWRYLGKDSSRGELAELEFYGEDGLLSKGRIMAVPASEANCAKEKAFDGDPLTLFQGAVRAKGVREWIGLAFEQPRAISKIRYLCWNDDNFIKNGEQYELYYWKGGGWKLLESKTGDNTQLLTFHNVPTNALFLLHDRTKGREERIFTYENGKQVWY